MEDDPLDDGRTSTPGFAKSILPTARDVLQITSGSLEDQDPIGPRGVKGIGEPAMVPTIPAILNAICDGVGVRIAAGLSGTGARGRRRQNENIVNHAAQ